MAMVMRVAGDIYLYWKTHLVIAYLKKEVTVSAFRGHKVKIEYTLLATGSCSLLLTATYQKGCLGLNGLDRVKVLKFCNEQRDASLGTRLEPLVLHEEFVTV